ncbi:hypothetical protein C7C46_15960 [Streptomyces tateyamensis]|uniref:histidine kinase n=1 Tax=Streptomyces tateyamensis TaxID=565073 RepID=A0A2V4P6E7_9ACTN|nr:ATP-binding protein [Streptomyces tateyamensis]PYC78596.1 hypothetical protein C7C46_15960 [Streptomyces tateyamensis]
MPNPSPKRLTLKLPAGSAKPPVGSSREGRVARRLARALVALPALATLTGCGVTGQGGSQLWATGGAAAVVLVGGTAVVVRRVTARPLERARDQAARSLAQLLDERAGLLAERDRLGAERDTNATLAQALNGERQQLLQEYQELQRTQQELNRRLEEAAGLSRESDQRQEELLRECELLLAERDGLAKERDELQGSVDATFVNLAMRTLTLVERQLVLIEALEGREADSAQLESLFRLDHLATRMRRNSENMLLLAGLENSQRSRKTVTLLDVVRAGVSEIERYERVKLGFLAAVRLTGAVADDTSHLLAELLENATAFSPPQEQVEIGGWLLDNGELMVSVSDRGIGLPADRLRALNEQLAEPVLGDPAQRRDALLAGALTGRSMGLFVVARLAARHGIRVQLRENGQGGGVTAMVVLPREALHQDGISTADLDDQRRAERTAAVHAARAAEDAEVVAVPPRVAAPASAPPAARAAELPELPRRRPAGAAAGPVAGAAPAAAAAAEPAPEPTAGPRPERGAEQGAEQGAEHPLDTPTRELTLPQFTPPRAETAAPELPRRVPSGNGLPGTGEAPTSGLRRVTTEPTAIPAPAATPDPDQPTAPASTPDPTAGPAADPAADSDQVRAGAEELRRRLGGFQRGLRQAAQESAAAAGAAQSAELVQEQDR